jgi:hypothetical protein
MNTQQKRMIISIICLFIIMLLPMLALADEIDTTPGGPDTPIDGGLSLLVAAGVGYGAKKMKERKANKQVMLNNIKD